MKRNHTDTDSLLDGALDAIRNEPVEEHIVGAAASRVQAALAGDAPVAAEIPEHVRGCSDVETLIPSYLAGQLGDARKLLFEDHMRECIPCRKALKVARTGVQPAVAATSSRVATRAGAPCRYGGP